MGNDVTTPITMPWGGFGLQRGWEGYHGGTWT